jgi:DNA-binding response OmpR family regulator
VFPFATASQNAPRLRELGAASRSVFVAHFLLDVPTLMSDCSAPTRRILLVAADENFSRTIGRILCRCGYTTEQVCSGEAALEALERQPYDLVLSEVALPGVCGLTLLCSARQHGRTTPFVLIGAPETERRRWIVSGVDDVHCLPLPLDVDRLKQVVAGYLER